MIACKCLLSGNRTQCFVVVFFCFVGELSVSNQFLGTVARKPRYRVLCLSEWILQRRSATGCKQTMIFLNFTKNLARIHLLPISQAFQKSVSVYSNYTGTTKCLDISSAYDADMGSLGWDFQVCITLQDRK